MAVCGRGESRLSRWLRSRREKRKWRQWRRNTLPKQEAERALWVWSHPTHRKQASPYWVRAFYTEGFDTISCPEDMVYKDRSELHLFSQPQEIINLFHRYLQNHYFVLDSVPGHMAVVLNKTTFFFFFLIWKLLVSETDKKKANTYIFRSIILSNMTVTGGPTWNWVVRKSLLGEMAFGPIPQR